MSETKPVIDTDPEILKRSADASLHAADETWIHVRAEFAAADGDYDKLMSTLRPQGPYGYTIQPQINPDGTVRAPILTTWDDIRTAYEQVRGRSDLLSSESLIEIRGTWYTFQEAVSVGHVKGEPEPSPGTHLIGMFPVGSSAGITGELIWPWVPREMLGKGSAPAEPVTDPIRLRRNLLSLHDHYLEALARGDLESLVATMHDDVQSGVRDYVAESGTLNQLEGKDANRAYYASFFDKFEVLSVDLLDRVVQDWYVFAEVRLTVQPRGHDERLAFHIAEFYVTANDGRFLVRIGHGTDPAHCNQRI
ncbi:MAG TPA: nuclear transport factor 2 family protein [Acidimicrobiales bacterium]|nr:nuclear transport factor 2 family protein [Acidimicrobiales bacterium]